MSAQHEALIQRFYEGINEGRLEVIDDVVSPLFVEHEAFPGIEPTRDGVRQMFELMRTAFPDYHMAIEDLVLTDDRAAIRGVMRGTHRGPFLDMEPTGKAFSVPFADFLRFDGGRIVEHWGVTDTGAMMQQLSEE